jgi:hypothetical protein
MKSKEPSQKLTIKEYIKKEKDLFTIASVFAALCLFVRAFVHGMLGEIISLFSLGNFVVVWIEILKTLKLKTFKREEMELLLGLFIANTMSIGLSIMIYWLWKAWLISKGYFIIASWYLISTFFLSVIDFLLKK